ENSIIGQLTAGLALLAQQYPSEDWGYFLNRDGTVRWSDVAFTGQSHGATSAAVFAHELRVYRAVSQAGPRDNTCGSGRATGDFNATRLPYDVHCPDAQIASWLDSPSATPLDRYYGFVGKQDQQYGDDLFSMERQKFPGSPVNISTGAPPYDDSHRFYAEVGHVAFESFGAAINIAFGVLPENSEPAF
ncbi:MAG TPA: hypothetical protein VK745_15025, partial [Polyangiaceae bacterium]|nr:hypothetical protein [Polyangiaceae bacterium]